MMNSTTSLNYLFPSFMPVDLCVLSEEAVILYNAITIVAISKVVVI